MVVFQFVQFFNCKIFFSGNFFVNNQQEWFFYSRICIKCIFYLTVGVVELIENRQLIEEDLNEMNDVNESDVSETHSQKKIIKIFYQINAYFKNSVSKIQEKS